MGWRTVLISGRAKLDLKLNYMVIRKEEIKKLHISEIAILIIDSTTISITTALIEKLVEEKVKIIFCGSNHNPIGEIVNYYNKHNSVKMIKKQIAWREEVKKRVWAEVIKEKINNQARLLTYYGIDSYYMLEEYKRDVKFGDLTNREGHAAKVYFYSLFGKGFSRGNDDSINAMLNFGYAVLLSIFTREITSSGYITQLGIFHENQFNYYNLASDLMEPLRPIVDKIVFDSNPEEFGIKEKKEILSILENKYLIDNKKCTLINSVTLYCKSIFNALENDILDDLRFINYEL